MKITKETLKQIIKEEIQTVLNEEKRELSDQGKKDHAENLRMAKDPNITAKELEAKMKLPDPLNTINDYKKYVGLSNMKLGQAINIRMTSGAAKKIAGTRM